MSFESIPVLSAVCRKNPVNFESIPVLTTVFAGKFLQIQDFFSKVLCIHHFRTLRMSPLYEYNSLISVDKNKIFIFR
jgi:hypothetical protein